MSAAKKAIKIPISNISDEAAGSPGIKSKKAGKAASIKLIKKKTIKPSAARKRIVGKFEDPGITAKPSVKKQITIKEDDTLASGSTAEESVKKKRELVAQRISIVDEGGQAKTIKPTIVSPKIAPLAKEKIRKALNKPIGQKDFEARLKDDNNAVKNVVAASGSLDGDVPEEESAPARLHTRRSVKLYRRIALSFIFFTLLLVAVIFYFTFIKVTIVVVPNQERINNNMIFDVYDQDKAQGETANNIPGIVRSVKIEHEKIYPASGTEVIGKEAVGEVTIYNYYTKSQPLVATTRLLAPDGKLFRIKSTVNIPVGGSVAVAVYADQPDPEMAIGPTKFTIPGLWAGLQDKIYAESTAPIVYQQKVKKHITEEDIENSIRDLKQQLLANAKTEINEKYSEYSQIIYKIDESSITSSLDSKVGEEVEEFTASMTAEVMAVAFNDDKAAELAKQKFISSLPSNKELISFDQENIIYALNNYDYSEGIATINTTFEGKVSLRRDSDIIEIDKILGLKKDQLAAYLSSQPEIAGYEITIFPSFINWVPKHIEPGKINIEVKR